MLNNLELIQSGLVSEPERLMMQIEMDSSEGKAQCEFIEANISEWLKSPKYRMMVQAQRYYENENDIINRKRSVIGKDGEMVDATYLSNNKLPHAYMRKLTRQKIGYLLSKPFSVTSNTSEQFQALLGDYIDSTFLKVFKNSSQESVVRGIGWLQPYYNEGGELRFKRIPSTEIIPFWRDIDHTILDAAIRVYDVEVYEGSDKKTVRHIKYFTPKVIYNYILSDEGLIPDSEAPWEYNFQLKTSSMIESEDGTQVEAAEIENVMWDRIPLIPLKYNNEEDSLLKYIKPLIDDYDNRTSDLSNVLEDEPNKIKVVKDYDGTDKGEFVYNLVRWRTLFLRGTGSVETLDTSISTEALESHLERTRKDIYEFGGGVDTQHKELGNASGVALKFIYADLDSDCSDFASELSWSMEQVVWFIKQDLFLRGLGDFTDDTIITTFNTDIAINETETVDNIKKSVGIVSNKTLLTNHPMVGDVSREEAQILIESKERIDKLEEELEQERRARNIENEA